MNDLPPTPFEPAPVDTESVAARDLLMSLALEVKFLGRLCVSLDEALARRNAVTHEMDDVGIDLQDFDLVCQALGDVARALSLIGKAPDLSGQVSAQHLVQEIRLGEVARRLLGDGTECAETMAHTKSAKAGQVDLF